MRVLFHLFHDEYALNEIVESHQDLTLFEARYRNDDTGRLPYDPKVLFKIVLFGYDKGIISSRKLAEECNRNMQFMALTSRCSAILIRLKSANSVTWPLPITSPGRAVSSRLQSVAPPTHGWDDLTQSGCGDGLSYTWHCGLNF